jgi:hypothetical protein
VLDMLAVFFHPVLLYSPLYQKRTFIGGYEVLVFSKRVVRPFVRVCALFVPVHSWRHRLRSIVK